VRKAGVTNGRSITRLMGWAGWIVSAKTLLLCCFHLFSSLALQFLPESSDGYSLSPFCLNQPEKFSEPFQQERSLVEPSLSLPGGLARSEPMNSVVFLGPPCCLTMAAGIGLGSRDLHNSAKQAMDWSLSHLGEVTLARTSLPENQP
jgi:hypothetical protein